jgi:hypothetical protein
MTGRKNSVGILGCPEPTPYGLDFPRKIKGNLRSLKSDKRGDDGGREGEGMGNELPVLTLLVAALVTGAAYAADEDQDIKKEFQDIRQDRSEDVKDLNRDKRDPG